jgi:hypothetical protein
MRLIDVLLKISTTSSVTTVVPCVCLCMSIRQCAQLVYGVHVPTEHLCMHMFDASRLRLRLRLCSTVASHSYNYRLLVVIGPIRESTI